MRVSLLAQGDVGVDSFLRHHQHVSLCHTPAWASMVDDTFQHAALYLIARDANGLCGVLPLTQVRSRLFGNRLISQAFSNYGGPLADSRSALDELYHRGVEMATELGCASMELRCPEPLPYDLETRTNKVCMRYPLNPDTEALWRSFKSKAKVRNHVRKAQDSGAIVESGGADLLDDFYRVWTIRMRQLGTPCYPRKLFQSILESFPDNARIFVVRLGGQTVGARFTISFNGLAESRWGATLVEYNDTRANHYLYWAAMKYYAEAGAKWFDFGKSTVGSSQYEFKKQWGAQPIPLYYQYWVRPGQELSISTPDNPRYRRKLWLWKRLPYWATRLIGPCISRSLP